MRDLKKYSQDEFIYYWHLTKSGLTPNKASEGVFKKFTFPSQSACDKWLQREIKKRLSESPSIYGDIPKPSTKID